MMTLLTNVAPIALGFVAKLFALKSQAASENQKLMIQNLQARNDSINQATPGSMRDIDELKAAMLSNIKNKVPKNTPNGIELKAIGRVTKTKPGPSDAVKPFAKTIGNIAIPAKRATPVSSAATDIAVLPIF